MSDPMAILLKPLNEIECAMCECFEVIKREREARLKAEEADRQKDAFLAIVAHELRNPLHSIVGWLELLRYEKLEEPVARRAIEAINRGVRLQAKIIEDLLDVSRICNGKLRLDLRETEIAPVIESVVGDVRNLASAKQIELELTLAPDLGNLTADAARLEQVLWNLLSNAIKFTPCSGKISVKTKRIDSGIELKVIDTGRGIEPEFLPQIFEPFAQSAPFADGRQNGIGLGLSIVRRIVELHGGKIDAHSAGCNQGATFTIQLPPVSTAVAIENNQFSRGNSMAAKNLF